MIVWLPSSSDIFVDDRSGSRVWTAAIVSSGNATRAGCSTIRAKNGTRQKALLRQVPALAPKRTCRKYDILRGTRKRVEGADDAPPIINRSSWEGANMRKLLLVFMAAGATILSSALRADNYPSRPITLVAVFGPGSASDTICRAIAEPLGIALKQSVVVEDRPGADGTLAALYVARAAPDGYTLLMATNSPLSAAPFLMKSLSYDAVKDFSPVTRVGSFTLMLVVNPNVPAKSVKELIEYAKANPGKLSFASANTSGIVAGETLKHWAGIDMFHVPYKSSPPALQDVISGRVSMMFTDLTTGLPHVKSGALRALAVTRMLRSSLFPELPTLDEAGVTGFDMDSWAAIVAPAHTPPAIVTKLNRELRKIIDSPELKSKLGNVGFEAFSSSSEELEHYIKVQLGKWDKMVKDASIQPQ
jgi:tripartite-type tricarboxylate transporter receptor subunit TctC